jgi:TetR/AcrR family transcriptional regulator, transcriptional repressor for nem operon
MFASPSKSNVSKAATTRLGILQKAFDLIYQRGFQATSIDDILATTQVTKGAFFYHFKNKEEMGLALINEVMYPGMKAAFSGLTDSSSHPVEAIHRDGTARPSPRSFFSGRIRLSGGESY